MAAAVSALIVWLPVLILTFTPLRSWIQGDLFQNPYYPIMVPRDRSVVAQCLAFYVLIIPATQYAWIRQGQPARYPGTGHWLLAALPVWLFVWARSLNFGHHSSPILLSALAGVGLIMAGIYLWTSRRLNCNLELTQS